MFRLDLKFSSSQERQITFAFSFFFPSILGAVLSPNSLSIVAGRKSCSVWWHEGAKKFIWPVDFTTDYRYSRHVPRVQTSATIWGESRQAELYGVSFYEFTAA